MDVSTAEVLSKARKLLVELGLSVPVTRSVIARLAEQYPEVAPTRRIGAGARLWPAETAAHVARILARETAEREAVR